VGTAKTGHPPYVAPQAISLPAAREAAPFTTSRVRFRLGALGQASDGQRGDACRHSGVRLGLSSAGEMGRRAVGRGLARAAAVADVGLSPLAVLAVQLHGGGRPAWVHRDSGALVALPVRSIQIVTTIAGLGALSVALLYLAWAGLVFAPEEVALPARFPARLRRASCTPFRGAAAAQRWFEWRRRGWFLVGALSCSIAGVAIFLPVGGLLESGPRLPIMSTISIALFPILMAGAFVVGLLSLTGWLLRHPRDWWRWRGCSMGERSCS
jgi:hypothetical protein